jgi:rhamnulokinase
MWVVKQCMDAWAEQGRPWKIEDLVSAAADCAAPEGVIDVDAEPLLLDGKMPERLNAELAKRGLATISDTAGNEPVLARLIFESLASRYASALANLEEMLGQKLARIHILGGGSRNKLLTKLTAERTGLPVEGGEAESSTIGNLAVQLAASEAGGQPVSADSIRRWAQKLCQVGG